MTKSLTNDKLQTQTDQTDTFQLSILHEMSPVTVNEEISSIYSTADNEPQLIEIGEDVQAVTINDVSTSALAQSQYAIGAREIIKITNKLRAIG